MCEGNGLVLTRFNPKEDVQQDNYSGKKIEVSVVSGFAGLRAFFEQLAHYQRIVSVTNFELKQLDKQTPNKTVDARFDLTAYYVSSERLQNQVPAPNASLHPVERCLLRLLQPRNPQNNSSNLSTRKRR